MHKTVILELQRVAMSQDGGKTWQDGAPHKVSIRLRHKDLLLEELPIEPGKQGFT